MKSSTIEIKKWTALSELQQSVILGKVAQMLFCLEKDIQHIQQILEHLDEIRALVLKRDENALKELLEELHFKTNEYSDQESQRNSFRKELAEAFNCDPQHITLSKLEEFLPEQLQAKVQEKKSELKILTDKLKKEHLNTVLLLAECARFNRLVFNKIFGCGKTSASTYNSSGNANKQGGKNFMNFKV
ncbi:MAG: hypothetical protein ACYTE8_00525 [Planctomycetota bacterium]|jgi:Fe2+ transport system protein B